MSEPLLRQLRRKTQTAIDLTVDAPAGIEMPQGVQARILALLEIYVAPPQAAKLGGPQAGAAALPPIARINSNLVF